MQLALRRIAIATSTAACVVLLSFNWSKQGNLSLGVKLAEARIDRPSAPIRVARRHYRRPDYGYRVLADAVAATTSPWNYNDYYCYGAPYAGTRRFAGGYYNSYPGGYCVSGENVTGLYTRPTLFPRYYGAWGQ